MVYICTAKIYMYICIYTYKYIQKIYMTDSTKKNSIVSFHIKLHFSHHLKSFSVLLFFLYNFEISDVH